MRHRDVFVTFIIQRIKNKLNIDLMNLDIKKEVYDPFLMDST